MINMTFDKGATTFDLQDTEFYDKYELFAKIKYSQIKPYRLERDLNWNQGQCVDEESYH